MALVTEERLPSDQVDLVDIDRDHVEQASGLFNDVSKFGRNLVDGVDCIFILIVQRLVSQQVLPQLVQAFFELHLEATESHHLNVNRILKGFLDFENSFHGVAYLDG